jgi:hypothetical protein
MRGLESVAGRNEGQMHSEGATPEVKRYEVRWATLDPAEGGEMAGE